MMHHTVYDNPKASNTVSHLAGCPLLLILRYPPNLQSPLSFLLPLEFASSFNFMSSLALLFDYEVKSAVLA